MTTTQRKKKPPFYTSLVLVFLLMQGISVSVLAKKLKRSALKISNKPSEMKSDLQPDSELLLYEYFKLKAAGDKEKAQLTISGWKTRTPEENYYKKYFEAQMNPSPEAFWELYQSLKKEKKLLRVQLESLKQVLDLSLVSDQKLSFSNQEFQKEARLTLKKMRGLPEGLQFELQYLKWIQKNGITDELCKKERQRWLSQNSVSLSEILTSLKSCPVEFKDFTYRTRLLIFSGEENKAKAEVDEYIASQSLADWEKAYLKAIFFSNIGDPTSAFQIVKGFETELLQSKDYNNNFFYIAQRAGELEKAEEIINKIIASTTGSQEKREMIYQKAFLFYQTKKYQEAIALIEPLIKSHPSRKRKFKRSDFDDLTWLRAWCLYLNKNYAEAKQAFTENKVWTRDKTRNIYWLAQTEWALQNQMKALDYF